MGELSSSVLRYKWARAKKRNNHDRQRWKHVEHAVEFGQIERRKGEAEYDIPGGITGIQTVRQRRRGEQGAPSFREAREKKNVGAWCGGGRRRGVRPFVRIGCRGCITGGKHIRIGMGYWDWGYLGGKRRQETVKARTTGGGIVGKIRQEGQKPGPGRGTMRSHRRTQGVIPTYRTTSSAHSAKVPGPPPGRNARWRL